MSKSWSIGWLALSSLLFLCACGGGGGGGTSGSTVGISFTPISVNTPQGFSQAFSFTATATGTVSQTLYPVLTDSQGVTDGTVSVNTLSELQYQVNLNTSCLLTQATHSGNFTLQLYTDSQYQHPYLASPANVPYTITVGPRHSTHKLLPGVTGVAFTSTLTWNRLARTIPLVDNLGSATPWHAVSNQTWLTVTPSGTTGTGPGLVLTANPTGLTAGLSTAQVTITSTDQTVATVEPINVGLWIQTSTPSAGSIAMGCAELAADPVNPYVYVHNGGPGIDVFNVYTMTQVNTLNTSAGELGAMAVAPDGSKLYALDTGNFQMVVVDLTTGQATYWPVQASPDLWYRPITAATRINVIRPNGVEVILVGNSIAYSPTGTVLLAPTSIQDSITATNDGHTVYTQDMGNSPASVVKYLVDYCDASNAGLLTQEQKEASYIGGASNGYAIAVSGDGTGLYTACGSPYSVQSVDPVALTSLGVLPGTGTGVSTVAVSWDDRVFVGGESGSGYVIVVNSASGSILDTYVTVPPRAYRVVVSGDGVTGLSIGGGNVFFVPEPQ